MRDWSSRINAISHASIILWLTHEWHSQPTQAQPAQAPAPAPAPELMLPTLGSMPTQIGTPLPGIHAIVAGDLSERSICGGTKPPMERGRMSATSANAPSLESEPRHSQVLKP